MLRLLSNLRIIRYADVVLMGAEAACESGNLTRARELLEMVRSRPGATIRR